MNNIKSAPMVLGFFMAILSLISCKKKDDVAPELLVTPTTISLLAGGGSSDITVTCNAGWSISNPASSWLQINQTTGNSGSATIHLTTLGQNGTGSTRSGILEISSSNGLARQVTVSQPAKKDSAVAELSVSPTTISFPVEGGSSDITVTCNAGWSISNPASSWLQINQTTGNSGSATIHLTTLGQNTTGSIRSGILEISSSNGLARQVTFTQPAAELSVSPTTISFPVEGGSSDITVTCNAGWSISNPDSSWLQINQTTGNSGSATIHLTTLSQNETGTTRSGILKISSSNGLARQVTFTQPSTLYPSYNTSPKAPDATGMSSTAVQLAAKMQMGINFGNTMESPNEGDWQSSKMTESYVKYVKQIGFNAVRIPCGWVHSHLIDPGKAKIDPVWLNRVKEVVGWCVANDMYVILNAHGDWGWLENNVNKEMQVSINAKQKAIWEQIATTMRDFDEHLIFAGANEPAVDNAEQMSILDSYHQTFINAVRSTGGRNSYRVLVVQGPSTDPSKTYTLMNTLPTDKIPNKLMVEVHDYTPSTFTILTDGDATWGKMVYYWGKGNHSTIEPERNATWGEEDVIDSEFQKMKQKFVDKGIPVLLGEYAAWRRNAINNSNFLPKDLDMHNKSVDYWTTYVTKQAKANGILPFYWEIGFMLDRSNNVVKDQPMLDALIAGYK